MLPSAGLDSPNSGRTGMLPLLDTELGRSLALTPAARRATGLVQIGHPTPLIPDRPLAAGEQYRFHFDMTKCIGCKCCVVACNEQNGNPAAINWRRVGEVEGGYYPYTQRFHLSMGCNHCLEPSCLIGCPVEAYTKDQTTGVVIHSADTCIGCQYCVWNCSYGVPQYNEERGVVGKCDLCHNRLADNMAPACASACPEGAIQIEIVNIAEWRREHEGADAPGLPSSDDSISTTRVTVPADLVPDMGRVDTQRIEPEHPHWALVFLLVLTQLSAGAFTTLWLLDAIGASPGLFWSALASLGIAAASLGAAPLHLGRPIYAFRALKGLRRSWLSREVLGLSVFAGVASAYAGMLFLDLPGRPIVGLLTAICGAAGVTCSAMIYVVRARPAWFTNYTIAEFFSTSLLLGPLFIRAIGGLLGFAASMGPVDAALAQPFAAAWIGWAAAAGGAAQLVTQTLKYQWLTRSEEFELRASAVLLSGRLQRPFLIRLGILVASIALALIAPLGLAAVAVLALATVGEWLGRYLFFVSVVPKNVAAAFTASRRAA